MVAERLAPSTCPSWTAPSDLPDLLDTVGGRVARHGVLAAARVRRVQGQMSPAWDGSTRRARLPSNWPQIRKQILRRDRVCQLGYSGCEINPTDVDHINPGDDHRPQNLQAVCGHCHRAKSSHEGGTAASARRASQRRPRERHPGLR